MSSQAVILGTAFKSFALGISLAHAEERATASLFYITERIRICMLQAENIISLPNATSFVASRNQLPQIVDGFRCVLGVELVNYHHIVVVC